jgi:hypothetical protein
MGRFDSLKENVFSSSKNKEKKRNKNYQESNPGQNSMRGNKTYSRLMNISANQTNNMSNASININKEDEFPELVKKGVSNDPRDDTSNNTSNNTDNVIEESSWKKAMKLREEKERLKEGTINQHDPKYWRGVRWIGPTMMRHKNYSNDWYKYMENVEKSHASSYIIPFREIEYSRDGISWYPSWNETFSEEQLLRIEEEEENEYKIKQYRILDEYRKKLEHESDLYYEEEGELDGYAIAQIERMEYEKYAEQFDNEPTIEENTDDMDSDDYLEDEN